MMFYMKRFKRRLPGQKEETVEVLDNPNEPIDITRDPDDTIYSVDSLEDYRDFMNRAKLI